jgi:NAD-dependent SIR2 family protein deacetylase
MEINLEQLKCGQCSEKKHELYLRENGEIITECVGCKSQSVITLIKPRMVIEHNSGDGTLCVF